jgi:hypothetical protein
MKRIPLKSILAGMLLLVVSRIQTTVAFQGIAEPPVAVDIRFNPASIRAGTSFVVTISGSNISDRTYVDLRFRTPGSAVDQFAPNWQRGTNTIHEAPASTAAGFWLVTGVGMHDNADDHTRTIIPLSVVPTVTISESKNFHRTASCRR